MIARATEFILWCCVCLCYYQRGESMGHSQWVSWSFLFLRLRSSIEFFRSRVYEANKHASWVIYFFLLVMKVPLPDLPLYVKSAMLGKLDQYLNCMILQAFLHGGVTPYSWSISFEILFPGLYTGMVAVTLWTICMSIVIHEWTRIFTEIRMQSLLQRDYAVHSCVQSSSYFLFSWR